MDIPEKQKKKTGPQKKKPMSNLKWVLTITPIAFVLSISMSYLSNEALSGSGAVLSFVVLFFFIALGIVFDMIGVAATSATEKEFHSMAARKVRGAKEAVWMTRNAEKASSICNDVVGDICGIISGSTAALIVASLTAGQGALRIMITTLFITGIVSAATIGGKAAGKSVAIAKSKDILFVCGRILSVLPIQKEKK